MWARRGLRDRERHRLPALGAPIEYVVFSVDQLDKHLVLTGRQTRHADCIVVTRFHPTPRQVVDVYVQMPDPWRYAERACPEHWYDMHVLRTILDPDDAMGQSCGKRRGVDTQLGWGLVLEPGIGGGVKAVAST
jgi:hypothetical protein